jgi:hypothetical protein
LAFNHPFFINQHAPHIALCDCDWILLIPTPHSLHLIDCILITPYMDILL